MPLVSSGSTSPARAGESLGHGRFELLYQLGGGGFGVVYKAYDRLRGQTVALKLLRSDRQDLRSTLKHEFRSLAGIAHPNLALLFDLIADGDDLFFTMELVEGVDFLAWVRKASSQAAAGPQAPTRTMERPAESGGSVSPARSPVKIEVDRDRLREGTRQLALGVHALHRAGKLHRDVKPSNIRVTPDGRVVLLDFGLVTELSPTGSQDARLRVAGSPPYMAPEQLAGRALSPASDWYSVGAVIHEALTGSPPQASSATDITAPEGGRGTLRDLEGLPEVGGIEALCRALLLASAADRPSGEQILATLGVAPASHGPFSPAASTPFQNREKELAELRRAYALVSAGNPVSVRVHGQSGLGKSALCRQFIEGARSADPDLVVLDGRCYEREEVAYKAVDSLVDVLARYLSGRRALEVAELLPRDYRALARLFPVLDELPRLRAAPARATEIPDLQELRRRAFNALRELLGKLTDRCPVILWIDDAQWGDEDSASLFLEVLRPPHPPALLLLISYRDGESGPGPFLKAFNPSSERRDGAIQQVDIPLSELPEQEARALAAALLQDAANDEVAEQISREARGSPLFIQQLAAVARTSHLTGVSRTEPVSLTGVFAQTLGDLDPDARRLMEVVAVAPRPLLPSTAFLAAGRSAAGTELVTRLVGQRFLAIASTSGGERLEPYHDKIREAVVGQLTPERLATTHRALAAAIEQGREEERDPELLLVHHVGCGDTQRAAECALAAAARAERSLAFVHAAQLYERAQALIGVGPKAHAAALRRAEALRQAGHGAAAAPLYVAAAREAEGEKAATLLRLAAEQFLISGHFDEALPLVHELARHFGVAWPGTPREAFIRLVADFARLRWRGTDFERRTEAALDPKERGTIDFCIAMAKGLVVADSIRGLYFGFEALRRALDAGEPRRVANAAVFVGASLLVAGGGAAKWGARLLELAKTVAGETGDDFLNGYLLIAGGQSSSFNGDWAETMRQCGEGAALLRERCSGTSFECNIAALGSERALEETGDVRAMRTAVEEFHQEALQRGDHYAEVTALLNRAWVALTEGATDEARVIATRAVQIWSQSGYHVQHLYALRVMVYADLLDGKAADALSRIEADWPRMEQSFLLRVPTGRIDALLMRGRARLQLAAGSAPSAVPPMLRAARRDARRLLKEERADARAHGELLLAAISADSERAEAHKRVQRANEVFANARMTPALAQALDLEGRLTGEAESGARRAEAVRSLADLGFQDPRRWLDRCGPAVPRQG
jgi:serine/threonine protein kinase